MENVTLKLVQLYLSGRFTPATEDKLQRWLLEESHAEEKEYASLQYWNGLKATPTRHTYTSLQRVRKRVGIPTNRITSQRLFINKWKTIAAFILLFVLAGSGYLWHNYASSEKFTEISVAYGETKYMFLPDGSTVWLNAGTTVRYPDNFDSGRSIYLDGEAYFSVKKDDNNPFVVHTKHFDISVLGTTFNVRAYSEDATTVATLESGKIGISIPDQGLHILTPGEQLSYNNRTSEIRTQEVPSGESTEWRSGVLTFKDDNLTDILNVLGRRFNLTVNNSVPLSDTQYTIRFTGKENISHILNVMSEMSGYSITLGNNTINVSR